MDEAMALILLSLNGLYQADTGDMTTAEAMNLIMNLGDFEADDTLMTVLKAVPGLESLPDNALEMADNALDAFTAAMTVWSESSAFTALAGDATTLGFFLSASFYGATPGEFSAVNASADLLEIQLLLMDSLDIVALQGAAGGDAAVAAFAEFLAPEIVLAANADADMLACVQAMMTDAFADGANAELTAVLSDALAAKADDAGYWDALVADTSGLESLVAFFDAAVGADSFDDALSFEATYDWDQLLSGIDLTQDWSTYAAEDFIGATAEIFSATAIALDPSSCAYFCGGPAPSGCWCDDHCVELGDCCADKADVCGENYSADMLDYYGVATAEETPVEEPTASEPVPQDPCANGACETANTETPPADEAVVEPEPDPTPDPQPDPSPDPQPDPVPAVADADGDGVPDFIDNCVTVANPGQEDSGTIGADGSPDGIGDACADFDTDGVLDSDDNCAANANPEQADANEDGIGTACDMDDDGVLDAIDNCIAIANPDQANTTSFWLLDNEGDACDDTDGDGVMDALDNCRIYANAEQIDSDADGVGDICEVDNGFFIPDQDNDTITDDSENCPTVFNPDQADDGAFGGWGALDGVGDACADYDSDAAIDANDNCIWVANAGQEDDNGDGLGNACDLDVDGVLDHGDFDNCIGTFNPDQVDTDGDYTGDACDADPNDPNVQ